MEDYKHGVFYDQYAGVNYGVIALLKYNSKETILVDVIKINRPEEVSDEEWENIVVSHVQKVFHKYDVTQIQNGNNGNDKTKGKTKRRSNK